MSDEKPDEWWEAQIRMLEQTPYPIDREIASAIRSLCSRNKALEEERDEVIPYLVGLYNSKIVEDLVLRRLTEKARAVLSGEPGSGPKGSK